MDLKKILFFLLVLIGLASCTKEEEEEEELVETEVIGDIYVTSVTIINVPPDNWDVDGGPDLQLKLTQDSSSEWNYITNKLSDVTQVPSLLEFYEPIKMTDELWAIQLIDVDGLTSDDLIYENLTFNPYQQVLDSVIPIYNNGLLVMELNYIQ